MNGFWDEIIDDEELKKEIKKLCLHANPTVAYNACKWVAEGKGYKSGLQDMNIEDITFKGLEKDETPF